MHGGRDIARPPYWFTNRIYQSVIDPIAVGSFEKASFQKSHHPPELSAGGSWANGFFSGTKSLGAVPGRTSKPMSNWTNMPFS